MIQFFNNFIRCFFNHELSKRKDNINAFLIKKYKKNSFYNNFLFKLMFLDLEEGILKKIKNIAISLFLAFIFICFLSSAKAEEYTLTDQQDDVYYQPGGGEETQVDISTQPNIDILEVSYSSDENTISISIKVKGLIQDSNNQYLYYGEYTSADAIYQFKFSNYNVNAMVEANGEKKTVQANAQVNDDKLTVTFDLATEDSSLSDIYGYGHFYEDSEKLLIGPKYIDTTSDIENIDPLEDNNNINNNGSNNNQKEKGTPGFEILLLITALVLVLALSYKNKKH